jgi:hypothetical protein
LKFTKGEMKMKTARFLMLIGMVSIMLFASGIAYADGFFIYPEAGQSQNQIEKDKYECYQWAKSQSGFDPMAAPTASTPPPQAEAPQGGAFRGAARGALLGVAIGAIAGDAGKGAAIGAAAGGLGGGMRRRDQVAREEQNQAQWEQNQAAQYQKNRSYYDRAYKACLEGRKYSVTAK